MAGRGRPKLTPKQKEEAKKKRREKFTSIVLPKETHKRILEIKEQLQDEVGTELTINQVVQILINRYTK